jgi:hypothetical protein
VTKSDPDQFLPTSVQKSYFMVSRSTRAVLDTALRKYRAKKYLEEGSRTISLEELRRVFGLESIKDA